MNRNSWAGVVATIAVIVVVGLGFRVLGGPGNQRLARTDQRTLQALGQLAQQINSRWQSEGKTLPSSLDKLPESSKKNPVTGAAFIYRVKSATEYELCSTFLTDNRAAQDANTADPWLHPKGDYCFSFDPSQTVMVPWVPNY